MLKRTLKWTALTAGGLLLVGLAVLLAIGLPRPGAITAENVPRIPWRLAFDNFAVIRQAIESTSVDEWYPRDTAMLIWSRHGLMERRLHRLQEPGTRPEFLAALPRTAASTRIHPLKDYLVFRLDTDGDEQYQIYRWEFGADAAVMITAGQGRHVLGEFDRGGSRLAYASTQRNGTDYDLYVMDPEAPRSVEMVFEGEGSWTPGPWSAAGDAFLVWKYVSANESQLYRFLLDDGRIEPVGEPGVEPVSYGAAEWGADGRTLFYVSDAAAEFKRLRRLDLETGIEQVLTGHIDWDVENLERSADGTLLCARINEDGVPRLLLYDVLADSLRPLEGLPAGIPGGVRFHPTENRLAVNHTDPSGLTRIYEYDLDTETLAAWTHAERAVEHDLPAPRLIHYPTFDEVDGRPRAISAFVYPSGNENEAEGASPVIIDIHGGPEGQARLSFDPLWDQIRRTGITIIRPNVRGSSGYGKTFLTLDNGLLRENSVKDIGSLLDWIADQPGLDEQRVAVLGGSYGGYMVLASLVHYGERIRCGVELFGISNFVTFLQNTEDYRRDLRRVEYGDERDPKMRAFLESISPANHASAIRTPLFVYGGANDPRVPVTESRQIVERVRGSGTEVWYVEAANEGHGLRHPINALYVGSAGFHFMERCLAD